MKMMFRILQLPDLKSQKYTAIHGQETRRKALSIQKDFLLLLSDLSQTYNLTLSITYQYSTNDPADQKLAIYLSISQPQTTTNQQLSADIEKIVTQGFLSQFYSIQRLNHPTIPILTRTDWVQYIGETIKYEEVITTRAKDSLDKYKKGLPNYYLPLQLEADENNDMLVVCEAISSFNSPLVLQITLEPDTATIKEKSSWINALDQMLFQLKQASSGSGLSSNREGDRNAQLVSRIYEKYQTTYLTESLYRYSFKAIGIDELAIRSILGTLLLSGTKKSRYRIVVIDRTHSQFAASLSASQNNTLHLGTHWSEWDQGLGAAEFGGDSITGKDSVRVADLKPLHRYATLNTQQSSPSIADLLKYPTIIELDYLNQDQANLMTFLLLTKIREYIKRQRTEGSGIPEHVILLEEAHNLVGRNLGANPDEANTKQEAANYVTRMLAEMRALRESIIIADQLPTGVAAEVVKNTNIKIAHRLVSADDRKEIGQAMLLDGSPMEEIARLNTGESFLYMEGWYRPHMIKIPLENSAKTKLGIENSITTTQISALIQPQSWYHQSQAILLATAIQEHHRLYYKCNESFDTIRTELTQITQTCSELRKSLTTLTESIFYRLTGELLLVLDPAPIDQLTLQTDRRLDARNLLSLKNLQLSPHLTLKDLLELRTNLTDQLTEFDRTYQVAIITNNRIPRQKYQQQWQSLRRQIGTVHYQITDLATFLNQPESLPNAKQQLEELDHTQRLIDNREDKPLRKTFEKLDTDRLSLQDKLMKVLNRAIEQAKINKAIHDLNLGET